MERRAAGAAGSGRGAPSLNRLLLDTSVLVTAERTGDLAAVLEDGDDVAMASLTLAELRVGVLLGEGQRQRARRDFVDALSVTIPILDYDATVAEAHARLLVAIRRQGRPRGAHDLVIAATAAATGRTVVTGDPSGFSDLPGVEVRALG